MTRIPHDYSVPNLPDFVPVERPEENPTLRETLGAAFGLENSFAAGWHMLTRETYAPDPNFDFEARASASDVFAQYPKEFYDVFSDQQFAQREQELLAESERRQTIAASGWSGVVASMAAGVLDPTIFIPGGTIYKGARMASILRSTASVAAAGAAGVAAQEAILQADQRLRTPEESAIAIAAGAVLGGLVGGGAAALFSRAERQVLEDAALDMVGGTKPATIFQPSSHPSALGASVNPDAAFYNLGDGARTASAFGLEHTLNKLNPVGRVLENNVSPTARAIVTSLDTGGLASSGLQNIGGDVESLAKAHSYLVSNAIAKRDEIMGGSYFSRIGGIRAFNEEVVLALRRGGVSDNEKVAEYAGWLRQNFFEPLRKEAEAVGLPGFQNLEEEYISKYAPRFAKRSLLSRDYDEFQAVLEEHFAERLTEQWTTRVEKALERNNIDEQTARILESDAQELADYRAKLEEDMAGLPERFDENVAAIAQRIRDLRAEAKTLTKKTDLDRRRTLREEADDLAEQHKELLAPFNLAERKLKAQFSLLRKTQEGIVGENRKILERIERTIEQADKTRERLMRRMNKLARGFEDLSPAARDAEIEKLVEDLHNAKDRELRALTKTGATKEELEMAMQKFEEADAALREAKDLDPAMAAERIENVQLELIEQAEALNAKRRAYVEAQAEKLRNPAEAAAEAEGVRLKARDRWFALQKKAAQANIDLMDDGKFDITRHAKELADYVASEYMGEGYRMPMFNIMGGERGPELRRMLDIDETRTWSNGRRFEEFLENDLDIMMRRYVRTLAPDIELYRKFGTVNPLSKTSAFGKRIAQEVQEAKDKAKKIEDPKKRERELEKITKEYEGIVNDLHVVLERVRNIRGIPQNPSGLAHRAGRAALNLNTTRMMGKVVISSVPDVINLMVRHGPLRFVRDAMIPMISDWKQLKLSLREAQLAGTALDLTLHGRSAAFGDIFDDIRAGTMAERGLQFMANNMGLISGMDFWNTGMKTLAGNITMLRLSESIQSLAQGTAKKADLLYLSRFGIDEQLAREIWQEMATTSTPVNGRLIPNTEAWTNANAKRAFRAAIARDVDDTIVTPGAERPSWMDGSMTGRLLGQFRSFTFSSTSKVLISGLQQAKGRGAAQGSVLVLSAMPFYLASGALSYYLWATTNSARSREEMKNADETKWLTEAVLRGLPLGVMTEVPNIAEDVFGQSVDRERSNFKSNPTDLLGPSVDLLNDLSTAASGFVDGKPGLSGAEGSSLKQLLPYNNWFPISSGLNALVEDVTR